MAVLLPTMGTFVIQWNPLTVDPLGQIKLHRCPYFRGTLHIVVHTIVAFWTMKSVKVSLFQSVII